VSDRVRVVGNFTRQFFLINDTPHRVAAGAAAGVFFGIMPGEGLATTLVVASLLKLNRLSAAAAVLATNTWTTVILVLPSAAVGSWFFGTNANELVADFHRAYHLGLRSFSLKVILDLALPLLVGFVLIAGAISTAVYALLWYVLTFVRREA
jgi:uncharacterized protein (DUF2062 family)